MPSVPMPQGMTPEVIQYVTEMIRLNLEFHDNGALSVEMARREKVQLALMKDMIEGEVGSVKQVTDSGRCNGRGPQAGVERCERDQGQVDRG